MGRIVVDVMLKPEILDPQGQAVARSLPRLGLDGFTDVRQGKRFVLTVDGEVTDDHLAHARTAALPPERRISGPRYITSPMPNPAEQFGLLERGT